MSCSWTSGWPSRRRAAAWSKLKKDRVGKGSLSHSDGAPAYTQKNDGRLRDKVRHGMPRNGGKTRPEYTKRFTHTLESGEEVVAIGGTQCLDGWWTHGKRAAYGVKASNKKGLDNHIREEQWRHWVGSKDRWVECGKVIAWVP